MIRSLALQSHYSQHQTSSTPPQNSFYLKPVLIFGEKFTSFIPLLETV